jgi:hypothetical protein
MGNFFIYVDIIQEFLVGLVNYHAFQVWKQECGLLFQNRSMGIFHHSTSLQSWLSSDAVLWTLHAPQTAMSFPIPYSQSKSINSKGKGEVLPRTGHEDPDGEQMYNSTLPSTSALDGGGWSTPFSGLFTPGTHCIGGWVDQRPVWTVRKILPPTGIRPPVRPAHSESLHRLSYPGPQSINSAVIQIHGSLFNNSFFFNFVLTLHVSMIIDNHRRVIQILKSV